MLYQYSVPDIDECNAKLTDYCPSTANHGICTNSPGNYSCACQSGYSLTNINDTKECTGEYIP